MSNPASNCYPCATVSCDNPFDRIVVSYLLRGGTRVLWTLRDEFADPRPYHFTLQYAEAAAASDDDWADVGAPVTDVYFAVDGVQRVYSQLRPQYYRVKLATSRATYHSLPTGVEGTLSRRDWRIAREAVRQELVRMRQSAGQLGYLLKRKISGERCPVCTDHLTGEVRRDNCQTCWGTGFYCGYYFPSDCVWADVSPRSYRVKLGPSGTEMAVVVKARIVNPWMLSEDDVWANATTDDRYYVHSVQNVGEVRGVPVVASVEFRPAPPTDVAYAIPLPQKVGAA